MKKLLLSLAAVMLCAGAFAQNGFNFFEVPRTVVLLAPTCSASGSTNSAIDLKMFCGVAKIDIMACTNAASTTTVYVQQSDDNTNFFALTNYTAAVPTTINYTNGTVNIATNQYLLPGSIVTPTAATAGFSTPYMTAPTYTTTTASFTATNQPISIGFVIDAAHRYLRVGFAATGSSTVGAYLTARPAPWSP